MNHPLLKGECYKMAAVCAKSSNKDSATVNALASRAYGFYQEAHRQQWHSEFTPLFNDSDIPSVCNSVTESNRFNQLSQPTEPVTDERSLRAKGLKGHGEDTPCTIM